MHNSPQSQSLVHECRILTRSLIGIEPSSEVLRAYCRAHELSSPVALGVRLTARDRALVRFAHIGPRFARAADAYSALFARSGLLRRKLVLLTAILESRRHTADMLERSAQDSRVRWSGRAVVGAGLSLLRAFLIAILILPFRAWCRLVDGRTR